MVPGVVPVVDGGAEVDAVVVVDPAVVVPVVWVVETEMTVNTSSFPSIMSSTCTVNGLACQWHTYIPDSPSTTP